MDLFQQGLRRLLHMICRDQGESRLLLQLLALGDLLNLPTVWRFLNPVLLLGQSKFLRSHLGSLQRLFQFQLRLLRKASQDVFLLNDPE